MTIKEHLFICEDSALCDSKESLKRYVKNLKSLVKYQGAKASPSDYETINLINCIDIISQSIDKICQKRNRY